MRSILILLAGLSAYTLGHQLTPTYPEIKPSHIEGVSQLDMSMFNRREDVEFYQIEVFDGDWNPISYAARSRLLNLNYLDTLDFSVYVRGEDIEAVKYICTVSRIRSVDASPTTVSSRVCSKIK